MFKYNIKIEDHRATRLVKSWYDDYDYFVIMDSNNMYNIMRIFGEDPQNKVKKLLSFCNLNEDIEDPWYSGRYEKVYQQINMGCIALLDFLTK